MRNAGSCSYLTYTVFPQLIKPFLYVSLGRHSSGALKSLGMPSFQFLFLKGGLKMLKMKALKHKWGSSLEENVFHVLAPFSSFYCKICFKTGALTIVSTCSAVMLCLHNQESTAYPVFLSFLFFPLKNCTCLSDKTAAEYFLWSTSLRDCFDWQPSMADFFDRRYSFDFIFIVAVKSLFCPFQASFFSAIRGFLCLLESILSSWLTDWLSGIAECCWMHRAAHRSDEPSSHILTHCVIYEPDESHEGTF